MLASLLDRRFATLEPSSAFASERDVISTLKRLLHHPLVNLSVGVAMVVAGVDEVVESLRALEEFSLQAGHGVMLMGVVTFLKGFVDGVEGLGKVGRRPE